MNLSNHSELRLLCSNIELNGNEFTTQHDSDLRRMQRQLDNRLGRQSSNLSSEDLMLLESLCLNSNRPSELKNLRDLRRNN